jgi:CheY-like chemotaxis protein
VKTFRDTKIGTRLGMGFALVLILVAIMGTKALVEMKTLSSLTTRLYRHPFTVSRALREIQVSSATIHYLLDDLKATANEAAFYETNRRIDEQEQRIALAIPVLFDRYLGDMRDVRQVSDLFIAWQTLHNKIVAARKADDRQGLNQFIANSDELIPRLESALKGIQEFAMAKAESFYQQAEQTDHNAQVQTGILLAVILGLGVWISFSLTRSITQPLAQLVTIVKGLALGVMPDSIGIRRRDEIGTLASSLEEMVTAFKEATRQAKLIAKGDLETIITPRSEADELGIAMSHMTATLRQVSRENADNNWQRNGLAALDDTLRGDLELQEVAERIITFMARYLEAHIGALYLVDQDGRCRLHASFAYSQRKHVANNYGPGEGLVGQVALEKKGILLTQVPEGYIQVVSGLGHGDPVNIMVTPFIVNNTVKAVVELGKLTPFSSLEQAFIESAVKRLAIIIVSAEARAIMRELLLTTQQQAEELQVQQEELKAANEELEGQANTLRVSEAELQAQQEELRALNEELEEKNDAQDRQRKEIEHQNQILTQSRRDLEQQANELTLASKYKSEFLANMSHELRTPLNSLLLLARNLTQNKSGNLSPDQMQSADIIYKSGNDLLNLINEILDLAKIESGQLRITLERVEIASLADTILTDFRHLLDDKGLTLAVTVDQALPQAIHTDRQRLEQIIRNLLANAIKFTREGGITVTFAPTPVATNLGRSGLAPDRALSIAISDTGIGIPKEQQAVIFEAFQQADGSTSRQYGGTGLGLSISRELAKILGGEIQLVSEPGKGSTFTIFMPLAPGVEPLPSAGSLPPQPKPPGPTSPGQTPLAAAPSRSKDDRDDLKPGDNTILIVEDDPHFAAILGSQCHDKGFKFLTAGDGEAGLDLVTRFRPSAIILDIRLPGMSGWEVLERLKGGPEFRHIPVHVMSAEEPTMDAFHKGVVSFLTKPVSQEQLDKSFAEVQRLLDRDFGRLLVVEDDDALRQEIVRLIGNGDTLAFEAATGLDAMAALTREQFDCMVLDLGLPDMSGFELLDRLAADHIAIPPVIVYTGRDLTPVEELRIRHYTDSVIIKGVKSEERLLDETALFLHRMVAKLPEQKRRMIASLHEEDTMFQGKKVLVVDDDMRNSFALSKVLAEKGLVVKIANDGQKALDALAHEPPPDLVLMDIMMPVLDGFEAIRRIRAQKAFTTLPIIALTAKAMREDRERCMEVGASDYLAKPVDLERLLSMMRVWLYR